MAYDIQLHLPTPWTVELDTYEDEGGCIITHAEAHLWNEKSKKDEGIVDVYVGDMPEDETAEDQAFANYAETVGFDEDDKDCPIEKFKFNGKNAWGFAALCEDDSPMRFISQEIRKGILAIIVMAATNDKALDDIQSLVERNLRIR